MHVQSFMTPIDTLGRPTNPTITASDDHCHSVRDVITATQPATQTTTPGALFWVRRIPSIHPTCVCYMLSHRAKSNSDKKFTQDKIKCQVKYNEKHNPRARRTQSPNTVIAERVSQNSIPSSSSTGPNSVDDSDSKGIASSLSMATIASEDTSGMAPLNTTIFEGFQTGTSGLAASASFRLCTIPSCNLSL